MKKATEEKMQIFWTKKSKFESKTNDPLGFNFRIKIKLFDNLFLGLTNPVTRAKYYILYPRFIQSLERDNKLNISNFLRLERAYLIATYQHQNEEREMDHSGILGKVAASKLTDEDIKAFDFKIFKNNQSGYNQLRGNLVNIGLIRGGSKVDFNDKLTSLGHYLIDNNLINTNNNNENLIKDFKKNECLCELSKRDKLLLRKVLSGNFHVKQLKDGDYDVIPDDNIDKDFQFSKLIKGIDDREVISILGKIRYHSLILILSIYDKKPVKFLPEFIKNCFSEEKKYKKIRGLWRFYFLVCGFHEICEMTLYLINEILKNKWDGSENQEVSLTIEEIIKFFEENLVLKPKRKYSNFTEVIEESLKIIKSVEENKEENLKKLPNFIKEYYRILYFNFIQESEELVQFLTNFDAPTTNHTLDSFLKFYDKNKTLEDFEYVFKFFKDFCLPRQNHINIYRNYRGKERVLLYQTEIKIISKFSSTDNFKPSNVLTQTKLTNNLMKIITDLGLIQENKEGLTGERKNNIELTEEGEKFLEQYHE